MSPCAGVATRAPDSQKLPEGAIEKPNTPQNCHTQLPRMTYDMTYERLNRIHMGLFTMAVMDAYEFFYVIVRRVRFVCR